MSLKLLYNLLSLRGISFKEHVGHTSLPLFKDDVLELLYVPAHRGENLEAVSQHTHFVEVPDLDLAQLCIARARRVDPVELVDYSFIVEFLDHSHSFLADGTLGLCCACTAVMSAVDSWMRRNRVVPVMGLLHCGLSFEHICTDPEVRASL